MVLKRLRRGAFVGWDVAEASLGRVEANRCKSLLLDSKLFLVACRYFSLLPLPRLPVCV